MRHQILFVIPGGRTSGGYVGDRGRPGHSLAHWMAHCNDGREIDPWEEPPGDAPRRWPCCLDRELRAQRSVRAICSEIPHKPLQATAGYSKLFILPGGPAIELCKEVWS